MPRTGFRQPSSESSAMKARFVRFSSASCLEITRIARAIGRSRWVPSLGNSAGARLMVTFLAGKVKPELVMAERTRSRASKMVLVAMPTMLKLGRLLALSASTVTILPS